MNVSRSKNIVFFCCGNGVFSTRKPPLAAGRLRVAVPIDAGAQKGSVKGDDRKPPDALLRGSGYLVAGYM